MSNPLDRMSRVFAEFSGENVLPEGLTTEEMSIALESLKDAPMITVNIPRDEMVPVIMAELRSCGIMSTLAPGGITLFMEAFQIPKAAEIVQGHGLRLNGGLTYAGGVEALYNGVSAQAIAAYADDSKAMIQEWMEGDD